MVRRSLKLRVGYEIIGIPDFGDDAKWMEWIKKNVEFDAYYGNSPHEVGLFEAAGFKVRKVPFFSRDLYSATQVRAAIKSGGDWRSLVPEGAIAVLEACGGVERIHELNGRV